MLPKVVHPDEVRAVVDMMKFPPLGSRGYDGIHADSDFGRRPAVEYLAEANGESFLAVQIEEPGVVPYIDEIAAMPGVDMLFVGPGDLSLGLGKFGHADDSEVRAIIQQVADACRRHGKTAGIPCMPEQVQIYRAMGYRFVNVISDYRCVANELKTARTAVCAALETVE
jgi:2-keto-3-deoxy-L-rhamnonate aldolase RhmA